MTMLKDITLGQYYHGESFIHKLDPRVKLVGTLLYMISLFIFNNYICYGLATVFLLCVILISRVPVKFMLKGMSAVFVLMIFTVLYNVFFTPGTVICSFWIIKISKEGLIAAGYMLARLALLVVGASIVTLTTTPSRLTDGLESLFKPLKLFKVPVHEMAMMMSIALRFIPILMEETDKIIKAQQARGAQFESKNVIKKIKALIPVLIPLFISAFRRAGDLALAMEARCYRGGEGRTKMNPLKYKGRDIVSYILLLAYLGLVIAGGIYFKRNFGV